jgi:hypothetical protein
MAAPWNEVDVRIRVLWVALILAVLPLGGCAKPEVASLRESFAQQVASNRFVRDFQRNGDELLFTAPDGAGGDAKWRIQIESAVIEANDAEQQPYKGTVKSSWYANGQPIRPTGRDSNLPIELITNGVSQDCWAFWDPDTERWGWE